MTDNLRAGRELDEACARAIGWTERRVGLHGDEMSSGYLSQWHDANGTLSLWGGAALGVLPPFSSFLPATVMLEDEIERRALWLQYIKALGITGTRMTNPTMYSWNDIARAIRATPEQRARAFLEAMKGAGE